MNEKTEDQERQQPGKRGKSFWLDSEVCDAMEIKKVELDRSESWMANLALRAFLGLPPKEGYKG